MLCYLINVNIVIQNILSFPEEITNHHMQQYVENYD